MNQRTQCVVRFWGLAALVAVSLQAADPYVSEGFLEIPASIQVGAMSAVEVDAQDRVYVLHRGEPPLLVFGKNGRLETAFGDGMFRTAHGLRIGPDGNVWITDNAGHTVWRFTPQGELLGYWGLVATPGNGPELYRSPDDLVFATNGDVYIADAGNGRVVRRSADGTFLQEWGSKGKGEGQFAAAHGIAIDKQNRIFVADRGNDRIQVFSPDGKFLAAWTGFGNPFGALVVGDELLVSDGDAHTISHLSLADGKLVKQWGNPETLKLPHLMAVDSAGRLYVAEVAGNRVQIFRPAGGSAR